MSLSEDLHALSTEVSKSDFAGSKATLKARMDALASRYREAGAGESAFQAFNRIYTKGAGVSVLRKYNSLTGPGYFEPQRQA